MYLKNVTLKPTDMETVKYSKTYRILHWGIAITFMLLLFTIFLRLTWMNKNNMADIIQTYLQGTDQSLSDAQLISLAKQIRKPMWDWHIYLGYILAGLFALRFTLPLFGTMKIQNPLVKSLSLKQKFQKWTYIIFYVCIVISIVTGLIIQLGPKDLKASMESIHVLGTYYLIAFIAIHLGGVFIAEFTTDKGIISRIVRGSEEKF